MLVEDILYRCLLTNIDKLNVHPVGEHLMEHDSRLNGFAGNNYSEYNCDGGSDDTDATCDIIKITTNNNLENIEGKQSFESSVDIESDFDEESNVLESKDKNFNRKKGLHSFHEFQFNSTNDQYLSDAIDNTIIVNCSSKINSDTDWLDFQEATLSNEGDLEDISTSDKYFISGLFGESLESKPLSNKTLKSLNGTNLGEVWNNLKNCDTTPALKFNWKKSEFNNRLMRSLHMKPPFSLKTSQVQENKK